jgi:2-polyprenyl-6-hydroxyphenyl methylase/3-demethylubiquinone-9 3-methyltransferase
MAAEEFVWCDQSAPAAHAYLLPATLQALQAAGAQRVLDLGCGNGAAAARLKAEGYEITGCDASASAIAFARHGHPQVEFFQHDIQQPLPSQHHAAYDAVVALEVVEHLLQPRKLIDTARLALYSGGILILSTPFHGYWKNLALALGNRFDRHWHPLRDFGHVKFFSRNTLSQLVEQSGFTLRQSRRLGRLPPLACSLLLVAVKPQ